MNRIMSDTLVGLSNFAAFLVGALSLYGSFASRNPWSSIIGLAFVACYIYARHRVATRQPTGKLQFLLILMTIGLSFALHMTYLPAGICCFFALMLCKNDLLLPPSPTSAQQQERKQR